MAENNVIHIGRPKPKKAEQCPAGMVDSKKIREVPLNGPLHRTLQQALDALTYVPVDLDTLQQLEQYRHEIYHKAVELARATHLPLTVMLDIIKSVEVRITQELMP